MEWSGVVKTVRCPLGLNGREFGEEERGGEGGGGKSCAGVDW